MSPENKSNDYTLIIEPKTKLLDLKLREVWRYRDLLMLFVRRDFVAVYKQTVFGPLWFFIQPILTTIMFMNHCSKRCAWLSRAEALTIKAFISPG